MPRCAIVDRPNTGARINVISVMGLERSGLSIAADRYSTALEIARLRSTAVVVSNSDFPEHGAAHRVSSISSLARFLNQIDASSGVCLWVGLHQKREIYLEQIEVMRALGQQGATNIVIPERTEMPDRSAYVEFEALIRLGYVAGLVHLNDREADVWSRRASLPAMVAPPPLPDSIFEAGKVRLGPRSAEGPQTIVFVGRLTRRKGADWLAEAWPRWRHTCSQRGADVRLRVFGRASESELVIAERFAEMHSEPDLAVIWQQRFLVADDIVGLSDRAVGISLSQQEFDGIASSELLALGLPVVGTPTSGHQALSKVSRGLVIRRSRDECVGEAARLLADDEARRILSRQAHFDMLKARSLQIVGNRLAPFLVSLRAGGNSEAP